MKNQRQIILDTETTGLRPEDGHRLIEIGCLEMIDRKLTGKEFHQYVNPQREIEAGAQAKHGITSEKLMDKPLFVDILEELMAFISGAELIIHNAPFDVGFINHELVIANQQWKNLADYCEITDTLKMARSLHVGQRNSLDALCKRYSIDNSKRVFHGALLDAYLLAEVYLAMTGGQGDLFETLGEKPLLNATDTSAGTHVLTQKHQLNVLKADENELKNHENYLAMMEKLGICRWREN